MKRKKRNWLLAVMTGMMGLLGFTSCCTKTTALEPMIYDPPPPSGNNTQNAELIEVEVDGKTVQMTPEQYQAWRQKQRENIPVLKYGPPPTRY